MDKGYRELPLAAGSEVILVSVVSKNGDANVTTSNGSHIRTSGGLAHAQNVAAAFATGDFLCFVESDEFIDENDLEGAARELRLRNAAGAFCQNDGRLRFIERTVFSAIGGFVSGTEPYEDIELAHRLRRYGSLLISVRARVEHRSYGLASRLILAFRAGQRDAVLTAAVPLDRRAKSLCGIERVAHAMGSWRPSRPGRQVYRTIVNDRVFDDEPDYETKWFQASAGAKYIDAAEKRLVAGMLAKAGAPNSVLDLGHGGGRWTRWIASAFPNVEITSVDRSKTMNAALAAAPLSIEKHRIEQGSFDAVPCDDGSFDLVLCIRSLKYASDLQSAVNEIARVTRPGGFAIIEMPAATLPLVLARMIPWALTKDTYPQRIVVLRSSMLRAVARRAGFDVVAWRRAFVVPARFYKGARRSGAVHALRALDRILPDCLLGRSDFFLLQRFVGCP